MANELGQKQSKRRQYTATIKIGQQYDFWKWFIERNQSQINRQYFRSWDYWPQEKNRQPSVTLRL